MIWGIGLEGTAFDKVSPERVEMKDRLEAGHGWALVILSLVQVIVLTFINAYFAAMLSENVDYIVNSAGNVSCTALAPISLLGPVLPFVFLALGGVAAVQMSLGKGYSATVILCLLSIGHMALIGALFVLAETSCSLSGQGTLRSEDYGPLGFAAFFIALALPQLPVQVRRLWRS